MVFTAISLVTDLSAQNYTLINGSDRGSVAIGRRLSNLSSFLGLTLLLGAALTLNLGPPLFQLNATEVFLMVLALFGQVRMQVPRALVIIRRDYRLIALADIVAALCGVILAVVLALLGFEIVALLSQLAATACLRSIIISIPRPPLGEDSSCRRPRSLRHGVRFGLRVIPLNVASYLARSIDSGLLPLLVPAHLAAGYARSYQVIIAPVTQIQIALGPAILNRMAQDYRATNGTGPATKKIWRALQLVAFISAFLIICLSSIIQAIVFGPAWELVNVTIAAMATCLPGIAINAFGSWGAQIRGGAKRTWGHLLTVMLTPVAVLASSWFLGFHYALLALVLVGGLLQPCLMSVVHKSSIPFVTHHVLLVIMGQWLVTSLAFAVVSYVAGFW